MRVMREIVAEKWHASGGRDEMFWKERHDVGSACDGEQTMRQLQVPCCCSGTIGDNVEHIIAEVSDWKASDIIR